MAAITIPEELIQYNVGGSFYAEAAINEPYACVIAGTADGSVIQSSAANQNGIGFVKYDTGSTYNVAGSVAQVPINTVVPVYGNGNRVLAVAGAAITKGALVGTAAGGQVVTATGAQPFVGRALTAAAAQHELIVVEVSLGSAT